MPRTLILSFCETVFHYGSTTMSPLKHFIRYLESSIGQQIEPGGSPAPMQISDVCCCVRFILSSLATRAILGMLTSNQGPHIEPMEFCFPRRTFRGFLSNPIFLAYSALLSMLHGGSAFAALDRNQVVNVHVK